MKTTLLDADKTYRVTARLGTATDTGDADGKEIETAEVPELSADEWRAILDGEGPQQTTPWFSLTSAEPTWEADESALMLQSIAHLVLFFGLVLFVRKPKRSRDDFKHHMEETI